MKFKDTEYGNLTNTIYDDNLNLNNRKLTSLEGCPKEVNGDFLINNNDLTSLKYSPKKIKSNLYCKFNPKLLNVQEEIIKHQIKAVNYITDNGVYSFEKIKEEFEKFSNIKLKIKNKNIDYGLGI